MSDTKKAQNIGDVTDIPAQLDVVPSVPGTYVGGHDMQGADGQVRTDRPGELLGTPIAKAKADGNTIAQGDYVRQEVDRAHREELPLLGGKQADDWKPGNDKGSKARTAELAPASGRVAATTTTETA